MTVAQNVRDATSDTFRPSSAGYTPSAATTLREHLAELALGGGHPLMVVVPRDALEAVLAENDELAANQRSGRIIHGDA